jgi:hypothetical protein
MTGEFRHKSNLYAFGLQGADEGVTSAMRRHNGQSQREKRGAPIGVYEVGI